MFIGYVTQYNSSVSNSGVGLSAFFYWKVLELPVIKKNEISPHLYAMPIPLPQGAGVQLFVIGEAPLKLCSLSLRVNFPGLPVERCLLLLALRRQFITTVQR